jgi:hypothetical protein
VNTTNAAVGTGAIVVLGRWNEGQGISVRVVVGVVFLAFGLSVLPDRLAVPFAWLVLVAVTFRYVPGIVGKSGIASSGAGATFTGGADSVVGV